MPRPALAFALCCLLSCRGAGAPVASAPLGAELPIDHVLVGIDSLERGIALLREATGVTAAIGGVHPGRGTRNALLSLGDGPYLELIAPNPAEPSAEALARARATYAAMSTPTPFSFAVLSRDADADSARLASRGLKAGAIRPGSRVRGDGVTLRWRTFDPTGDARAWMPFAIEWGAGTPHPSRESPGGCRLVELRVHTPSADSARALLARAGIGIAVEAAAAERMTLTLDCPAGRVRLP
jgi:hypothetical protein